MKSISMHVLASLLSMFFLLPNVSLAAAIDDEVKEIKHAISSGYGGVRSALNDLRWSGYQREDIYDPLAKLLEDSYQGEDKTSIERSSWYVKGIGYSGMSKYEPLIDKLLASGQKKLVKYATKAREDLQRHAEWNPVISQGLSSISDAKQLNIQRVKNMLNSNLLALKRSGLKRVYFEYSLNQPLTDIVASQLAEYSNSAAADSLTIDAVAWMCKALGKSGNAKYRPVLESVAEGDGHKKIKKHAKKALGHLS